MSIKALFYCGYPRANAADSPLAVPFVWSTPLLCHIYIVWMAPQMDGPSPKPLAVVSGMAARRQEGFGRM